MSAAADTMHIERLRLARCDGIVSSWLEFTPLRAVFGSIQPELTITVK
jgi:hypothetical protein